MTQKSTLKEMARAECHEFWCGDEYVFMALQRGKIFEVQKEVLGPAPGGAYVWEEVTDEDEIATYMDALQKSLEKWEFALSHYLAKTQSI
jgi:hypothetical protein